MPKLDNDQLLQLCNINKDSALTFRQRRHDDWTENYAFYRDKVMINRLTQRQSVNVPLMKYSLKSILKDVDDPPMLYFNCRSNDAQKEVFYNEYWKYCATKNKLIVKDIVDKKQVLLFGRSFKKLNILDGAFSFEIVDPQDMLVDRYVDPANLDSARFICHEHIFKALSTLSENPNYDKEAITKLKEYFATQKGLLKAQQNAQDLMEKNERMEQLGLIDAQSPELGETYVELNENYVKIFDEELKQDVFWLIVTAEGTELLFKSTLEDYIGTTKEHFWRTRSPFTTWGEDVERTDFWNDGIADTIRTPNKIVNSWVSQLVENRTLRNFGMHYYNSTLEGFSPQTFEPTPWGWYPVPGNPSEVLQKVEIPELSESLDEIKFVLEIAERATAATATQQGSVQTTNVTLGEVQLALANAKERIKSMSILYTDSWEEFGLKYIKLLEAAGDKIDAVKVYRKGLNTGNIYSKEIAPSDWEDEEGYEVEVKDLSSSASESADTIQKLNAAMTIMPMNQALSEIYKQRMLEFAGLNANEVKQVMEAEKNPNPLNNGTMVDQNGQPIQNQPMMGGVA